MNVQSRAWEKGLPRFASDQCPSYVLPLIIDHGILAVMVFVTGILKIRIKLGLGFLRF